jgi:predicted HAD superfamily Cof-like phosphohydrolase
MTKNWIDDIHNMQQKYGVHEWIDKKIENKEYDLVKEYIKFRLNFLNEELTETNKAFNELDGDELVDGLIDLCVVAIGTLDALDVDSNVAWDRVLKANLNKTVGVKETRPNPLGLPDLIKPEGWTAPTHKDNIGVLEEVFNDNNH